MDVTFVLYAVHVFLDDYALNVSGFGVPPDMVSHYELFHRSRFFQDTGPIRRLAGEVADRAQTRPSLTFTSLSMDRRSPARSACRHGLDTGVILDVLSPHISSSDELMTFDLPGS